MIIPRNISFYGVTGNFILLTPYSVFLLWMSMSVIDGKKLRKIKTEPEIQLCFSRYACHQILFMLPQDLTHLFPFLFFQNIIGQEFMVKVNSTFFMYIGIFRSSKGYLTFPNQLATQKTCIKAFISKMVGCIL